MFDTHNIVVAPISGIEIAIGSARQDCSPLSRADHDTEGRHFVVTQNKHGYWVASETRGLIEGVFVTRRDAIRFALFEAGNRSSVVAGGPEVSAESCSGFDR